MRGFDALDDSMNGGPPCGSQFQKLTLTRKPPITGTIGVHRSSTGTRRRAVWAGGGWGFVFNPDAIELKCAYPGEFSPPAASHAPMDLEAAPP